MIDYGAGLFERLNQAALTNLLGEISLGVPALLDARAIPEVVTDVPVINFYRTDPIDGGSEIDQSAWSVNCRAENEIDALEIAQVAFVLLKRTSVLKNGYEFFFIPSILGSLPPADMTDLWNVPVEVLVKARKI